MESLRLPEAPLPAGAAEAVGHGGVGLARPVLAGAGVAGALQLGLEVVVGPAPGEEAVGARGVLDGGAVDGEEERPGVRQRGEEVLGVDLREVLDPLGEVSGAVLLGDLASEEEDGGGATGGGGRRVVSGEGRETGS